jgi:hypothetical protein
LPPRKEKDGEVAQLVPKNRNLGFQCFSSILENLKKAKLLRFSGLERMIHNHDLSGTIAKIFDIMAR